MNRTLPLILYRCPPAHRLCVRRTGTTHHRHEPARRGVLPITARRRNLRPATYPKIPRRPSFSPSPRTKTAAPSGTPATRSVSSGTRAI